MNSPAAQHWRKSRRLSYLLMTLWFTLTFGGAWYARELNAFELLGFPLGFYLEAQGLPVIFLAMIWIYNRYMDRLDKQFSIDDE